MKQGKMIITTSLIIAILLGTANATFELNMLQSYQDAVCLDGTAAGVYFEAGSGDGADQMMIYFQGGGACVGLNDEQVLLSCLARSKTTLGSSLLWKNQFEGDQILSSDAKVNPHFYNWNQAFIPYCDGMVHTGYTSEPKRVLGFKIHFNGYNNTVQSLSFLERQKNMKAMKQVLVSGVSAGGMGAFIWTNFIRDILPPEVQVYSAPDSGLFLDFYGEGSNFHKTIISLVDIGFGGADMIQPPGCEYESDPANLYKCTLPQYFGHRIKTPLLIINSEYDQWSLDNILSISCADSGNMNQCSADTVAELNRFREALITNATNIFQKKERSGAFMPACVIHGLVDGVPFNSNQWEVPDKSGNLLQDVLYRFVNDLDDPRQFNYIDAVQYPLNTGCNYQTQMFLQKY